MENYLVKYDLQGHSLDFLYHFLDRLRSDCEYYLGNGGRYHGHLWTGDEYEQVELMRAIWKALPEKPDWLPWERMQDYARRMRPMQGDDTRLTRAELGVLTDAARLTAAYYEQRGHRAQNAAERAQAAQASEQLAQIAERLQNALDRYDGHIWIE